MNRPLETALIFLCYILAGWFIIDSVSTVFDLAWKLAHNF